MPIPKEPDFEVNLTVDEVRAFFDGLDSEELTTVLDEAQGKVHQGLAESATILITITKE